MIALSVLTGDSSYASSSYLSSSSVSYESKAVRAAKALFTADAAATTPWDDTSTTSSVSSQLTAILSAKTIIDKTTLDSEGNILTDDVQTSFTAYKALDKLRILAEAAADTTTSDAVRAKYQKAFAAGLEELQAYLGTAPSDLVDLAFGSPSTTAKSTGFDVSDPFDVSGAGLVSTRSEALPGLTGSEQFTLSISRNNTSQTFTVDLSQGPQPPTINSVVDSLNAQLTSAVKYNADGTPELDSKGNPVTVWHARFEAEYTDGKWGLKLTAPDGIEKVSLDQVDSKDSLVVTTGQTAEDAVTATQVFRVNDPAGADTRSTMGTIEALDRITTAQNELADKTTSVSTAVTNADGELVLKTEQTSNAYANTDSAAVVTDGQGFTYVVGTTSGDLGANLSDGDDNLFLTKMDSSGNVVWQRSLGATGSSSGAAVSIAPDGSVVVAGTVTGTFNGSNSDGDMVVAKYSANGDEQFSTLVRSTGVDSAKAVVVGSDGSIYVGGKVATNGGDAMVARIDTTGNVVERRTIGGSGSDTINGLALDQDGNLLALVSQNGSASVMKMDASSLSTDLGSISLGTADARAIAVAADGTIAVGGATSSAIAGTQVNALNGGRDGFVTRIDSGLTTASTTYIGTSADDQVDSIAFMGDDLYAGGRTTGDLGATKTGTVDGFITRIDTATGAIEKTDQFGAQLMTTEPVRVTTEQGGSTALSALGFSRGVINSSTSDKVTTQTTVKAGDYFKVKADDNSVRTITIEKDDTLSTIATKLQGVIGASKGTVTATTVDGVQTLKITMKAGHELELIAGSGDLDALAKLGIEPQRLVAQATVSSSAPSVRPGGSYGLDLTENLSLATLDNAKVALSKITDAISMTQTAYRSLYWDDTKASIVDSTSNKKNTQTGKHSTAVEEAQLKNYQAALERLSSSSTTSTASILLGL